ncbi:pentatricopeptide repeat-containing protein At2g18940, chloroplastic-like [Asparagus officinalis]|uniref:pentatricopeptide repeat-containing protein At2g18940, chloroplastic-like n=1 Tax=Asparagus officinalis TaxID=4686 RepID=UPI00098E6301|nr:pentatricopeptide repeat-containing protein At2g18940, chloroplastic-like [Asparagus officinalis]
MPIIYDEEQKLIKGCGCGGCCQFVHRVRDFRGLGESPCSLFVGLGQYLGYFKESQHSVACKVFHEIIVEDSHLDDRAYCNGLVERTKDKGLLPSIVTYNVMLDVYGRKGRSWGKVLGLLDETGSNGLVLDEFTCSTVIAACGRVELLQEAMEFFKQLKSQGYVPDTVAYNYLLQVFGKAGNYPKELRILKEMEECNCEADDITYDELDATYARVVISVYGKAEREDEVLDLFYRIKELGCVPNVCTFDTVLGLPGKKLMSGEMLEVLLEMKSNAYGRCGSHSRALNKYDEMAKVGFSPCLTTYNALLNAITRNRDWRAAESVMDDMRKKGFKPNELYYSLLLRNHA